MSNFAEWHAAMERDDLVGGDALYVTPNGVVCGPVASVVWSGAGCHAVVLSRYAEQVAPEIWKLVRDEEGQPRRLYLELGGRWTLETPPDGTLHWSHPEGFHLTFLTTAHECLDLDAI